MPPPIEMPRRDPARAEKVDRYGELCRIEDEMAPIFEEKELLKEEIQKWFKDADPEKGHLIDGNLYTIQLGAKSRERTIIKPLKVFQFLKKHLGLGATVALLKIPLGEAVDKYIPASEQKLLLVEERSGSRRLKCVAKASPAPAKKVA